MTLDERLAAERAACHNTSSEAWRYRCEIFHYARLSPERRAAAVAEMRANKSRPDEVIDRIEAEVTSLCAEIGVPRQQDRAARQPGDAAQAATQPPTHGAPWTPDLDNTLTGMAKAGTPIAELASHFGRSPRAIGMRLERLRIGVAPTA